MILTSKAVPQSVVFGFIRNVRHHYRQGTLNPVLDKLLETGLVLAGAMTYMPFSCALGLKFPHVLWGECDMPSGLVHPQHKPGTQLILLLWGLGEMPGGDLFLWWWLVGLETVIS